jgi:hypothetical protein
MKEIEIDVAEALLNTRVRINVPAPWFLFRRLKVIPVVFYRPVYAQLLRISRLYVKMNIDLEKLETGEAIVALTEIAKNGVRASRIIACGMIRSTWTTFLFHRLLARYLRRRMDAATMAELTKIIVAYSGAESFTNIIRSIAHMKVTAPNLSRERTES